MKPRTIQVIGGIILMAGIAIMILFTPYTSFSMFLVIVGLLCLTGGYLWEEMIKEKEKKDEKDKS